MSFRLKFLAAGSLAAALILSPAFAGEGHKDKDHGSMDHSKMDMGGDKMIPATGVVQAVRPDLQKLGVAHDPIKALDWPAMKMAFMVDPAIDLAGFAKDDVVSFTLQKMSDGKFMIHSVCKTAVSPSSAPMCAAGAAKGGHAADEHAGHGK
jgi:Cu(I)/Ag(I) efflux system periplasmic protein CusF